VTAALYQRRPATVEAIQWLGNNAADMTAFAGPAFTALDEQDRANSDDPEATAELFDGAEWRRRLMYYGDWAVREGEHIRYMLAREFEAEWEAMTP
jgi:hypothetical protein